MHGHLCGIKRGIYLVGTVLVSLQLNCNSYDSATYICNCLYDPIATHYDFQPYIQVFVRRSES